jgi:hypothetical protein
MLQLSFTSNNHRKPSTTKLINQSPGKVALLSWLLFCLIAWPVHGFGATHRVAVIYKSAHEASGATDQKTNTVTATVVSKVGDADYHIKTSAMDIHHKIKFRETLKAQLQQRFNGHALMNSDHHSNNGVIAFTLIGLFWLLLGCICAFKYMQEMLSF